ncbi:MAG: hypothetical protein PVF96_02095 [Candidatus Bathyarchaeota archaeon]
MSTMLQKEPAAKIQSTPMKIKRLNAETVTAIALNFLKRIGYKRSIQPKKVSLEDNLYIVEVEMNKSSGVVRIDASTHEIKEYEILPKREEESSSTLSPRRIVISSIISVVVYIMLHFIFEMFGL